jgi:hypothetical protein
MSVRSTGRPTKPRPSSTQTPTRLLLHQVNHIGNEVSHRVIHHHIALVIAHLITRRGRRQIRIHRRRHRRYVRNVAVGEESAGYKPRPRRQVDISQVAQIVAMQPRTIIRPPSIDRTIRRWTAPRGRTSRTRRTWPRYRLDGWPPRIRPWRLRSWRIRSRSLRTAWPGHRLDRWSPTSRRTPSSWIPPAWRSSSA